MRATADGSPRDDSSVDLGGLIAALEEEHAALDPLLDRLRSAVAHGHVEASLFHEVSDLLVRHYAREEEFFSAFGAHEPAYAAKLQAQHAEALEIAGRLAESLANGEADALYLARRFVAISQHNLIEEERDVFPLARRIGYGR